MANESLITKRESRNFRAARLVWPFLFVLAVVLIAIAAPLPMLILLGAVYVLVTLYLLFWPCPRCHRLYGIKLGLISIAWPFFSYCLHCGSKLDKTGANSNGASLGT